MSNFILNSKGAAASMHESVMGAETISKSTGELKIHKSRVNKLRTDMKPFKLKKQCFYLLVAAIVASVVFVSCKKDEDGDENNTSTITENGKDTVNVFAFTADEQQKINTIKSKYSSIQTSFSGGYFIKEPTITPSYTIGEVKKEVLQAGVDAINMVRYIAGIPNDIELDDGYTELNQHGAVLLTAINTLTHYPEKPADMDQDFYDKGALAAKSSNISTVNTPSTTIFRYMDDSNASNIDRVGHRRWILNPTMKKTGFGVGLTKYGLMYSKDRSRGAVDYDYIAWPSPGVFPIEFINYSLAWSVTVNAEKYGTPDINKIEVTLKNLKTGEVCVLSKNTPSSPADGPYFNVERSGYGILNCIIFRSDLVCKVGDVFQATITGLNKELSYTVKIFSM